MDNVEPKFQFAETDDPLVNDMLERIDRIGDAYKKMSELNTTETKYKENE